MLCGALSTTSAIVPTILPLPLSAALSSFSQLCPPTCPLLDSLSILQVVRFLASSQWTGQSLASSCSFPNCPGHPGDWGFLSLPTFFRLDLSAFLLGVLPGIPAISPGPRRPSAYRPFPSMSLLASLLRALPGAPFLTPSAVLLCTFPIFGLLPGQGLFFLPLLLWAFC